MAGSDGEEYLCWRSCQDLNDQLGEQRVLDGLSKFKRRSLLQLRRNKLVFDAFDKLRKFRGLWSEFLIGDIPQILSWKCPNPVCSYLGVIYSIFETITGQDSSLVDAIDLTVVKFLRSRCPRFSYNDQQEIQQAVQCGKIFSALENAKRNKVIENILGLNGVILTFATFFNHSRYLKAMACMSKAILPEPRQSERSGSIRSLLSLYFQSSNSDLYVEASEGHFDTVQLASERRFACAYLQLCIHAIRYYLERQNNVKILEKACIVRFVELARKIGFDSPNMMVIGTDNRPEKQLVSVKEEFEVAIAPQSTGSENHVALLQKKVPRSEEPQFSTDVPPDKICNGRYIFLPTFQRGPHGPTQRYASTYCLLYYAVLAFFHEDIVAISGISATEIPQRLGSNDEASTSPRITLDIETRHDIPRETSSVYSVPESFTFDVTSPPQSYHRTSDSVVGLIRGITRPYASSDHLAFLKLETLEMKVVSLNWNEIAQVVTGIDQGSFARRSIDRGQVYGIVLNDRLLAFPIRSLQSQLGVTDGSDFRHVVFIVDRDSVAERTLFSGRTFQECCQELLSNGQIRTAS